MSVMSAALAVAHQDPGGMVKAANPAWVLADRMSTVRINHLLSGDARARRGTHNPRLRRHEPEPRLERGRRTGTRQALEACGVCRAPAPNGRSGRRGDDLVVPDGKAPPEGWQAADRLPPIPDGQAIADGSEGRLPQPWCVIEKKLGPMSETGAVVFETGPR
jgi:hypothetical protein